MRHSICLALGVSFLAACSGSSSGGGANDTGNDGGSGGSPDGGGTNTDGGSSTNDGGTSTDGSSSSDGSTPSEAGTNPGFRAITLPGNQERVTGVYCSDAHTCVFTTDLDDGGHIYASDGTTVTGTMITGDETFAALFGTIGTVSFLGVSPIGGKIVARVDGAEAAFVSATGSITAAASWSGVEGVSNGGDFGLNAQYGIGTDGTHWTYATAGRIWEAASPPSSTTAWTNVFSPQAVPPIPSDIEDQRTADPTLCDTDPSVSIQPDLTQSVYVAADDSLIITPSGAVNQGGNDTAGVCISVDRGHSFHHAEFTGVAMGAGPVGVTCTSATHCVAYGGVSDTDNSAYVYVSGNAMSGATSTWTKATTPTVATDTQFRSVAFAPDQRTGWLVGTTAAEGSLFFTTTDGGATWTDATGTITGLTQDNKLHTVYAFDATHVWIGGENDTLLASGN